MGVRMAVAASPSENRRSRCVPSRARGAKPIQVLPGGEDLNTTKGFHTEKVIVAGDDDLGASFHSALEDHVILRISAYPMHDSRYFYMFSIPGVFGENGEHFLILPGELPYQHRANFRDDLIANRDGLVV